MNHSAFRNSVSISLAFVAATISTMGCSGTPSGGGSEQTGSVGLELQLAQEVSVNTISWQVTNSATAFSESGATTVQFSNTAAFQVGGLPSGAGYSITLAATSTDRSVTCNGAANFSIAAGVTSLVPVTLYCIGGVADAGNAAVTATTQVCANINSLGASPTETSLGESVSLSAAASAGNAPVSYAWTSTAGSFDNPSSATPVFTCPNTPVTATVTLTVSPSATGCPTNTTESVAITCDALDPTFTNVYSDVIGARCTGCHAPGKGGVTVGMLDMSTPAAAYANLVNVPAMGTGAGASGVTCGSLGVNAASDAGGDASVLLRVVPDDPTDSLLFEKVNSKLQGTNPPCGSGMPLTGAPLTAPQVGLIQAWIAAGALND
jgi:hypothetical protein